MADLKLYHPLQKQGLQYAHPARCFHYRNRNLNLVGFRSNFGGSQFSRRSIFQQQLLGPRFGRFGTASFTPKSSNDVEDATSKPPFSFKILDILGLLIRIPAFVLGFLGKGKFVQQIEDQIEDAAEVVEDIAETVENIAETVAKVAGTIAKEAQETQDLMDKVEESTKSLRSDIGTAIDVLEGAVNSEKYSETGKLPGEDVRKASGAASRAVQRAESVKEAASEAANKAKRVKEATDELEKVTGSDETKQGDNDNDVGDSSKTEISQTGYRATVSSSFVTTKFIFMLAMLFAFVFTSQMTSTRIMEFFLQSLTNSKMN